MTHIGRESVKKLDWVLPFSSELPSSPKRGFGGITPRPPREILKIYFKSGISGHVAAMLYFTQQLAVLCYNLRYFVVIGSNSDLEVEVTFAVTL